MAQNVQTWVNPLPGAVGKDLSIIFNSLTSFFLNPTFPNGANLGNGTPPAYDPASGTLMTPAPAAMVDSDTIAPLTQFTDMSTPATPSVTVFDGVRSLVVSWPAVTTSAGFAVKSYTVQYSTDPTFATGVTTMHPTGPIASFNGLTTGATYHVRVQGVSYGGTTGSFSTSVSGVPAGIAQVDLTTTLAGNLCYNGTAGNAIYVQGGRVSVTTDGIGDFTFIFPTPFPNTGFVAVANVADIGSGNHVAQESTLINASGFGGRIYDTGTGAAYASATVDIAYVALGT